MYTIKCEFFIDENLANKDFSLLIGPADMPYDVYINGNLIFKKGNYIDYYSSSIYETSNILLSKSLLNYGVNKNIINIQMFPLYERTFLGDLVVTSKNTAFLYSSFRNLFNVNLIQGSCLISLILSLYFLLLFFGRKLKEIHFLYFSCICLFFAMSYYNIFFHFFDFHADFNEKISRSGFPLASMSIGLFIIEYSKLFNNKKIFRVLKYILIALISIFSIACSILTAMYNTKKEIHYIFNNITANYIIPPILIISMIILIISIIKSIIKKSNFGIIAVFLGFIVVIILSYHDIYYLNSNKTPFCWTVPYGYLAFVLSIFFTLSIEQSMLYSLSIRHYKEIDNKNKTLGKMMQNIKTVSDNLVDSSTKLELSINKAIKFINEYGDNNKTIMGKILNQFSNIDITINQIKTRIIKYNENISSALLNQQNAVKDVNLSIANMNNHIESTSLAVEAANQLTDQFAKLANQGSVIIYESKESIDKIAGNSKFLNEVLNSIQDITDKTNVLAINAAIEAANRGELGKGFAVIAAEIRKLANQSKVRLITSFDNINNMSELVSNSANKSEDVAKLLLDIIDECQKIVNNINEINLLMHNQKDQSNSIIKSMESLFIDTDKINEISKEEKYENEKTAETLEDLKLSFKSIANLLDEQKQKEKDLQNSLISIKEVMVENLKDVEILNDCIKTNK
jgi:methyl-accepting chemotaxis protein